MSENIVAVRSIEIVTAEITMIRDNARKVFLELVIQIGTRLEEAKQMVPSGEWTAYGTHCRTHCRCTRQKARPSACRKGSCNRQGSTA